MSTLDRHLGFGALERKAAVPQETTLTNGNVTCMIAQVMERTPMARREMTPTGTPNGKQPAQAEKCGVFSIDEERVRRGRAALPPGGQAQEIADTFKMLAHPTRVKLIRALASGELCVCEISEVVGLSVSATSHQLHQLRDLRLVRSRTDGKLVHYSLRDPFVISLLEDCARHVSDLSEARE